MMEKIKILLVEDEPFIANVIEDSLKQKGFGVTYANDGKKAYNLFLNNNFNILLIDVMLPHMDGFTLVKEIRKVNQDIPVLFLTAKTDTESLKEGYLSGGNDYLRKPFSLDELFLRIEELLKRANFGIVNDQALIAIGKYIFNYHKQELCFNDIKINLSNREAELLFLLYKNKNELMDRKMALLKLWGDDSFFNTRTMDVFISKLRKYLNKDENIQIINARGFGFKLIC